MSTWKWWVVTLCLADWYDMDCTNYVGYRTIQARSPKEAAARALRYEIDRMYVASIVGPLASEPQVLTSWR